MDSLIQNTMWCGAGILLNIVIFVSIRANHKKYFMNQILTLTNEEYAKLQTTYSQFWYIAKMVNITIRVIIFAILVLFNSYSGLEEHIEMGSTLTQQEASDFIPETKEEISITNKNALNEKEEMREAEIMEDKEKSKTTFSDFLNNL